MNFFRNFFFFFFPENYSRRVRKSTNKKNSGLTTKASIMLEDSYLISG